MRVKPFALFLSIFLNAIAPAFAGGEKTNITIASQQEVYTFMKGDKDHPVNVKVLLLTTFRCNEFHTTLPYEAYYNDQITVGDLRV
ncbi:hypothetical protein GA0116948_108142 [Chitinophaga costaii]|uniref:Uncharacterized protein n=1 Tax=Chitinophaga costaii TaxID=1335309 RepID=A0A1C4EIT3_9BACT|nr:hypothetical protein [Chitinophaga costaii]PUZ23800.1 hypothetical protein DCM91_13450 [Chitinophaga costaii]SCC43402.1 hypothetical protein GA0116948_108142 [Chitinophaga costaii]